MNIELKNINKRFQDFALFNIDFQVRPGEFFVILGPSGAGKTLILEIIAGLIKPDSGTMSGIDRKKVGFIYQDYWLFPHLNVFDNIAYGLKVRKQAKQKIILTVKEVAGQLEIDHLLDRRTDHLSGGEKQRVAIARAMAISPDVYLFDEPTSSLDRNLRLKTRKLFMNLHQDPSRTFIHVTHDFEEALSLADRLAILMDGRIVQCGKPDEIFSHPETKDIADFLGYRNVFGGMVRDYVLQLEGITIQVPLQSAGFAYVAIRSDDIIISRRSLQSSARNSFYGRVEHIFNRSTLVEVVLNIGVVLIIEITRKSFEELKIKLGDQLWATFKVSAIKIFKHD
jgi:molybdate/tungstate transport system ATP-binding protein